MKPSLLKSIVLSLLFVLAIFAQTKRPMTFMDVMATRAVASPAISPDGNWLLYTNYGERHKMEISGDYFRQGYDDIMTGVDHLIAQGLVDGDKMGAMGWSAGGHWSN
jgi:dipeptidyl aminopeptidase/acylaminoacyl peptidase